MEAVCCGGDGCCGGAEGGGWGRGSGAEVEEGEEGGDGGHAVGWGGKLGIGGCETGELRNDAKMPTYLGSPTSVDADERWLGSWNGRRGGFIW